MTWKKCGSWAAASEHRSWSTEIILDWKTWTGTLMAQTTEPGDHVGRTTGWPHRRKLKRIGWAMIGLSMAKSPCTSTTMRKKWKRLRDSRDLQCCTKSLRIGAKRRKLFQKASQLNRNSRGKRSLPMNSPSFGRLGSAQTVMFLPSQMIFTAMKRKL